MSPIGHDGAMMLDGATYLDHDGLFHSVVVEVVVQSYDLLSCPDKRVDLCDRSGIGVLPCGTTVA